MKLMVAPAIEVRRDFRKNFPWVLGIILFAISYVLLSAAAIRTFENNWSFLHACYFTVINMTTVGFGDVVPLTHGGKLIAGLNSLVGLLLFGVLVAIVAMALQPSGWSADLTSTGSSPTKESKIADENIVENSVANLLEELATLVRITDRQANISSREGSIRIDVMNDGHPASRIRVFINVRAD